ncbi:hypothetical protein HMPREF1154_0786 [Capnocytophaga sp. CM59]|nr:hypothetical protein HMPREF1154_0786 [Capnocytophaga sp. CM59]
MNHKKIRTFVQRKTTFLITQKTKYFFSYFTLISLFWLRFYIFLPQKSS